MKEKSPGGEQHSRRLREKRRSARRSHVQQTGRYYPLKDSIRSEEEIDQIELQLARLNLPRDIRMAVFGILDGLSDPDQELTQNELLARAHEITARVNQTVGEQEPGREDLPDHEIDERLEVLFKASNDIHLVVDKDSGNILYVNDNVQTILGHDPVSLIFSPFHTLLTEKSHDESKKEYTVLRSDGSHHPVECKVTKIPWKHGEALLITLHDLRKNAELRLEIREVAHNFNNDLMGLLEQLKLSAIDDPGMVEQIEENIIMVQRCIGLNRKLQRLATEEQIVKKRCSITSLIRSVLRTTETEEHVAIETDLKGECIANIDPDGIAVAIKNLLINANHAIPKEGKIKVEVEEVCFGENTTPVSDMPPNEEFVCVTVTDTGVGIPPSIIKKIFDPSFSTKRQGTGLGLPSVHRTVRAHRGYISVESRTGNDSFTRFRVYLPIENGEEITARRKQNVKTVEIMRGRHIIVVEDERALQALNRRFAKDLTITCNIAQSAEECLELIKCAPMDTVILMDQSLGGGIKGTDIAKEVKERRPDIIIILCTGYSSDTEIEDLIQKGVIDRFLPKPYTYLEVKELLKEIFLSS